MESTTDRPLTLLALLLIPIFLAPHLFSLSEQTQDGLLALDYLIWGLFAADFAVKLAIAPERKRFLATHWIEALLVALPMLRPLRAARAVQGMRIFRVALASVAALRVIHGFRRVHARDGVRYVLLSGLIVVVVAGCMVTVFERQQADSSIRSLPDGLWWAVTTVTTVGYGDTYPKTSAGRGVGVALMLIGIGLFGALTASLATLFIQSGDDEVAVQLRELNARLQRIEDRLSHDSQTIHD